MRALLLALLLCLACGTKPPPADPNAAKLNELAVHKTHEGIAEAWSKGDKAALSVLFSSDVELHAPNGDVANGPEAAAAALIALGKVGEVERGRIRMVAPDVALWRGTFTLPGAKVQGHIVDIVRKGGYRWIVDEMHVVLHKPMPATAASPVKRAAPTEVNTVLLFARGRFAKDDDAARDGELSLYANRVVFVPKEGGAPLEAPFSGGASVAVVGNEIVLDASGSRWRIAVPTNDVWRGEIATAIAALKN